MLTHDIQHAIEAALRLVRGGELVIVLLELFVVWLHYSNRQPFLVVLKITD